MKFSIPDGLSEKTVRFISEVLKLLNKDKQLKNVDHAVIEMLAISYETYLNASKKAMNEPVVKNYRDEFIPNPAATVAFKYFNMSMSAMVELGITLKSRTKGNKKAEDEETNPLENFLSKRGR